MTTTHFRSILFPHSISLPVELTPTVILLETLCSSINPFIYTLFSATIRRRIVSSLRNVLPRALMDHVTCVGAFPPQNRRLGSLESLL